MAFLKKSLGVSGGRALYMIGRVSLAKACVTGRLAE